MIVVNSEWYFVSHRLALARALRAAGYDVVISAPVERQADASIVKEGLRFVPLDLRRRSLGLWQELKTLFALYRLYTREKPDLVHHVTVKPIVHGSLAAMAARVPAVINAISGRGEAFNRPGPRGTFLRWSLTLACRIACAGARTRVIFQNPDDQAWFVGKGVVGADRAVLIRGAGVDLDRFHPSAEPAGRPIVVLASRLLWNKGIREFVDASRRMKHAGIDCRCVLVGIPDEGNPNSIPVRDIEAWQTEGTIEWWGLRDDMPAVFQSASVVVLPTTYPEGVPKILLEAAASGRPIVATDAPGCREVVADNVNGLLVPPRDSAALADAVSRLLRDPEMRARMGARGREIAVAEFSEDRAIAETLAVYRDLLGDIVAPTVAAPVL